MQHYYKVLYGNITFSVDYNSPQDPPPGSRPGQAVKGTDRRTGTLKQQQKLRYQGQLPIRLMSTNLENTTHMLC